MNKIKKTLLALVLLVIITGQNSIAQGNWELLFEETSELGNIKGICFVPGPDYSWDHGWAVQAKGTILKTTDGGDTWSEETQSYSTALWGIDFVNEDLGFVCGSDGKILKTEDGGVTWSVALSNGGYFFQKIKFKDSMNGVVVGIPNMYTNDGGETWNFSTGASSAYWGLDHAGGGTYYGVEAWSGAVGKTTDNGETWSDSHFSGFGLTASVDFYNLSYGIVTGDNYEIEYTHNGGQNWATVSVDDGTGTILAASWFDQDTVWISGSGIYKSTDAGENWVQDTSMTDNGIQNRELFVTGRNVIYASGDHIGTGLRQIWRKIDTPTIYADFVADQDTVCAGSSVSFTDLSIGNIDTWEWEFEGGNPATSTDQNPTVTYSNAGIYDVKLVVTVEPLKDSVLFSDYITVVELPDQANTPEGETEICTGQEEIYTTNDVLYAAVYEWEIAPSDAGILTWIMNEATLIISDDWNGDFTIKVRASNVCGNGDWSDNLSGTVYQTPTDFNLEGGGGYCLGEEGVEITLSGSETGINYELYFDGTPTGNIVAGTGDPLSFGIIDEEGTYTAVGYSDHCESNMNGQLQVEILFVPTEPSTPTGPTEVCNNESTDYESDGTEDANEYVWVLTPEDAGEITYDNLMATVNWNPDFSGEAEVALYGINDCGDGNLSLSLVVTVDAVPSPEIAGPDIVCNNHFEDYIVQENDGSTYIWEVTGGTITEGQGTYTITVEWGVPGTGIISVTEETENGCSGVSEEFEVTIDDCTGIEDIKENKVLVSPNPVSDNMITVRTGSVTTTHLQIIHSSGAVVSEHETNSLSTQIDISALPKGLYFLKATYSDKSLHVVKFIKR